MGAVLTVVVPIYNVGRYLAECLDSVAGQTYADLEVVLVDDGSTDDSAEIAARYCRDDGRFRLVRQPNRGLGAARNAGIGLAGGDYLTFLDSDDVLPPYALEVLVGSLEQTGSDFASGNVALLTSRGLRQSPLHRGTHRFTRLRVNLAKQRNLAYDRLVCNKVFRRSFWERHGLRFPEGVRYEDIPLTIPAYALAESVDVLELPVYYWRQREAGAEQSISQRLSEVRNLVDRFAAVDSASQALAGLGDGKLKDWYDETALQSDLRMFLHQLPDTDEAYRERFLDLAGDYLGRVDQQVLSRLTPPLRVAWRLARRRQLPELLTVVEATRGRPALPTVRRGLDYFQDIPYLDAGLPGLPRSLFRVGRGLRTTVHEVRWYAGRLRLTGHAYSGNTGAARPWSSVRGLWLREDAGARRWIALPTAPRRSPDPPAGARPYAWSGFRVTIDPAALRRRGRWVAGTWSVLAADAGPGGINRRVIDVGEATPPLPARWVADDVRIVPLVDNGGLRLRVERVTARATAARIDEDQLVLSGSDAGATALRLCRVPGLPWRSYPVSVDRSTPDGAFVVRIPLADLLTGRTVVPAGPAAAGLLPGAVGDEWSVELAAGEAADELPVSADFTGLAETRAGRTLLVESGDRGGLWVRCLPAGPLLTEVREAAGELVLSGPPAGGIAGPGFELVLRFRDETLTQVPPPDVVVPVERTGTGWRTVLRRAADTRALSADGCWWLLWRRTDPDGDASTGPAPLNCASGVRDQLSARWIGGLRLEADRRHRIILRVAG
jgi:hypothetical protein